MTRLEPILIDAADPAARRLLEKLPPLNVFSTLAHSPAALEGFVKMGNALLYRGSLDPALRELVILRVGHRCGSAYEVHQHEDAARQVGLGQEKISCARTDPNAEVFSPLERASLRYTDEIIDKVKASQETFTRLRDMLDEAELVELTLCVGFYTMVASFLETMEVEIEAANTPGLVFGEQAGQ